MKIRILLTAIMVMFAVVVVTPTVAQQKCDGPQDLCAQILELQKDIATQKAVSVKSSAESVAVEAAKSQRMAHLIAMAASLAVVLKLLISMLKSWTTWLENDKQKAMMKAALLLLGFGSFVAGNIGMGLPWWQALVVAGGPPGAILVHELSDLFLVFKGKKKLTPDLDPTISNPPPAPPAPPTN
jgi:hypothetical protein